MNRQIVLARRPDGEPVAADFELTETAIPEPGDGQFLARTLYLSLDPANDTVWATECGD